MLQPVRYGKPFRHYVIPVFSASSNAERRMLLDFASRHVRNNHMGNKRVHSHG